VSASVLNSGVYRASEVAVELTPRIKAGIATHGVVYAHHAGGNALTSQGLPSSAIVEACAADGYLVHAGDLCAAAYQLTGDQGYNWGNTDHLTAIGTALTRLGTMGATSTKLMGVATSMGCIGLLNYAKANPTKVAGLALFLPVLDLLQCYLNLYAFAPNATTLQATLDTAYGLGAPAAHASCTLNGTTAVTDASSSAAIVGWYVLGANVTLGTTVLSQTTGSGFTMSAPATGSATQTLSFVPPIPGATISASSPQSYGAATFGTLPIALFTSDNDPLASNTAAATAWAAGQSNITVTSLGSIAHALPTTTSPAPVVAFFDANGGQT
jgi:alpha-beta hydrolase superfamily lysophospholipase